MKSYMMICSALMMYSAAFGSASAVFAQESPLQESETQRELSPSPGEKQKNSPSGLAEQIDQEIAAVKLAAEQSEIELARIALEKATNEQVKQFAAKMVKEHSATAQKLESLAGNYGPKSKTDAKTNGDDDDASKDASSSSDSGRSTPRSQEKQEAEPGSSSRTTGEAGKAPAGRRMGGAWVAPLTGYLSNNR